MTGFEYVDLRVSPGSPYQYRIIPIVQPPQISGVSIQLTAGLIETGVVQPTVNP